MTVDCAEQSTQVYLGAICVSYPQDEGVVLGEEFGSSPAADTQLLILDLLTIYSVKSLRAVRIRISVTSHFLQLINTVYITRNKISTRWQCLTGSQVDRRTEHKQTVCLGGDHLAFTEI